MADQNPSSANANANANAAASTSTSTDFPVFLKTSLGSNLVMVVSNDDTVRDLKKKVVIEHGVTFPDIGEITVHAIEVYWVGSSYRLSDCMLVQKAFDGNDGIRFLDVDASITVATKEHKTDSTGDFLIEHNIQQENLGFLQSEPGNSCMLANIPRPTRYSARDGTFANSTVAQKGDMVIGTSGNKVKGATKGYSDVVGNSISVPEKRTDVVQVEKGVAGPDVQIRTDLLAVQEQDDLRDGKHEYVPDKVRGQCMYSTKSENGKQRNELQDDDQAEHLSIGKKKHKKKKEKVPINKIMTDPKATERNDIYKSELQDNNCAELVPAENKRRKKSKEIVSVNDCIINAKATDTNPDVSKPESGKILHERILENKGEENALGSTNKRCLSQNGLELSPSNLTKSKKRRKKSSKPHCKPDEAASLQINEMCPPLDKGKCNDEAGLCVLSQNKSCFALAVGKRVSDENVGKTLENKIEDPELHDANDENSHHLKESTKSGPALSYSLLPETENSVAALEEVVKNICQQPSKHASEVPTEKLAAVHVTENDDRNEMCGNIIKVDSKVCSDKKSQLSDSKATASEALTSLPQHVTEKNPEEAHNHCTDLAQKSSGQVTIQQIAGPGIPLEVISKVSSDYNKTTRHSRKKSVKTSDKPRNNDTTKSENLASSLLQVTEKKSGKVPNHHIDMDKQTNRDLHLQGPTTREAETKETEKKPRYVKETEKSESEKSNMHLDDSSPQAENNFGLLDRKSDTNKSHILGEAGGHNTSGTSKEPSSKEVQTGKSRIKKGDKKQEVGDVFSDSGSAKVPQNDKYIKLPRDIKRKASLKSSNTVAIIDPKVEASRSKICGGSYDSVVGRNADTPAKKFDASLVASSDSTDDSSAYKTGHYRVAVRKVPGRKLEKISNNSKQRTLLTHADTIFDNVSGAGSDDEPEVDNGKVASKHIYDTFSTSSESDGEVEDTQTMHGRTQVLMGNLGGRASSANSGRLMEIDGDGVMGSQSNKSKLKLGMILRNSSSYKKAKLSQSHNEEEESEPIDFVQETQPEFD